MRKLFTFLVAVLLTASVFAQSPEKMSYQALIRDASDNLITNTAIGMQISILQGSASGTAVYVETQSPTTNANGLVTIEIGNGTTSDDFSTIDWSAGTYFIKTETDPTGGTTYSITGTSQLMSVPYALHAKTAETITGAITETDPIYGASQAANITATDITNLGNLSGVNTGDQDLSTLATKTALGDSTALVRSEIPDVSGFLTSETDPTFTSSQAASITATDITNLGNLSGTNTGDQNLSTLATKTALGDSTAQVRSEIPAAADGSETKLTAGTNITVTGSGTIASPYVVNAIGGGASNDFYLGQDTLGGIVFYIYIGSDGNQHGLIVNPGESTAQWQSSGTTTIATRSWDGVYNMGLMTGSPAKTYCQGLSTGGFTDWYLPSIDELSILWHNRFHANNALNAGSYTLLSTDALYWSSTEYNATYAFYFTFSSGYPTYYNKTNTYSVRAVRAF